MLPRRRQGDGAEEEGINSRHISPYRLMLDGVSQHLTLRDCRRIGMLIGLTPAEDDTIQNSVDLLRMMEQRNDVSERNVSYLREILTKINRDAAVDYLRQYEKTLSDEDSNHSPETDTSNINGQVQEAKVKPRSSGLLASCEQPPGDTFIRENGFQILSERYVRDQRRDQLAAKAFSSCIEVSLKKCVRDRICVSLYERITRDGIFYSRSRFLKVVLKSLCLKNNFLDYMSFISDHNSFTTRWIVNYIANQCSKKEVDIEQIALCEVDWLLSLTEKSLEEANGIVYSGRIFSFHQWLKSFSERFERNGRSALSEKAIADLQESIHVSNYDLFTNECRHIIREFKKTSLLETIPDTSDVLKVKGWLDNLPQKIHEDLARCIKGCGKRCPFCKTFCEATIKEHTLHFASWHFPRGIAGLMSERSGRLVTDICTENVATNRLYCKRCCGYDANCKHDSTTLFKYYKIDFPDWSINPSCLSEPLPYWKWVLNTFNKDFAEYYGCKPAEIPYTWQMITKEEALKSIEKDFY